MKSMSISIRVENMLKTRIGEAQDLIQSKYGVKFQKQNQVFPHINLISGKVADVRTVNSLLDSISLPSTETISSIGLGCFLTPNPTIFVRYKNTKNIFSFRSQLLTKSKYWISIDRTCQEQIWLPKTTIAFKDVSVFNLGKISTELLLFDFSLTFKSKALVVLEYAYNRPETLHKVINLKSN